MPPSTSPSLAPSKLWADNEWGPKWVARGLYLDSRLGAVPPG